MTSIAPPGKPTIHFDDGGFRVAVLHNVMISVWTGLPTGARLAAMRACQTRLGLLPPPLGVITILQPMQLRSLDLSESVRSELVKIWRTGNSHRGCSVVVIESEGLMATSLRLMLNTVKMVAKSANPSTFVAKRLEAARWMAPQIQSRDRRGLTDVELLEAMNTVAAGLQP